MNEFLDRMSAILETPVKELFERFGFTLESFTESEKVYSKLQNL